MVLFLIFLVLKLTQHIEWSWWWVLSPLWMPLLLAIIIICYCISIFICRINNYEEVIKMLKKIYELIFRKIDYVDLKPFQKYLVYFIHNGDIRRGV